ncbi:MAG: TAT-variant-translocated molybdopterin oxidoreductase, partial [Bacteroidia bacterium]|nr:TAT-variant-translocated molybdopterin oxidoreductase [Bacteroidia bacterium]
MSNKKYWKSLEEYNGNPEFLKAASNEFAEEIPVDKFLGDKTLESTKTPRRDFLKFLGFSVTAASLAACEAPVRNVIPYLIKPEEINPGISNYYASTFYDGMDYASVLVKVRDGRPIKIEGNKFSSLSKGGTNARTQASVLNLYDSARAKAPMAKNSESTWEKVDTEITSKLAEIASKGSNIRLLTSTIISPSTKQIIQDFITKYPSAKHIQYDTISYSGLLKGNELCFGKPVIPFYDFEKAAVVVGFSADFLGNWLAPIEFTKGYSKSRRLLKETKQMTRHYHFESNLSVTGANADYRSSLVPSQIGFAVLNLYNEVAKLTGGSALSSKATDADQRITQAAKDLVNAKGKSLVVCGVNDPNVQCVVNCINSVLGNLGTTVDFDNPILTKQGIDSEVVNLINEMNSGSVAALFVAGVNPAYSLPASLKFADAVKKVNLKVSFNDRTDETYQTGFDYLTPDNNYLESWGDANPRKGFYSLQQPTINPLFKTRQLQDSLLKWSGSSVDYYTYLTEYWTKNIFSQPNTETNATAFWNTSLKNGVFELPLVTASVTSCGSGCDLSARSAEIAKTASGTWEITFYTKNSVGDGSCANNPWLQEMPDPISKAVWDNYITMSPAQMKKMGFSTEQGLNKLADRATVVVNGVSLNLPVIPQPGQKANTIAIALGYGRTNAGKTANGIGANAFQALSVVNGFFQNTATFTDVKKDGAPYLVATTQSSHTMMGRSIVKEASFKEWSANPAAGNHIETFLVSENREHKQKRADELDIWASKEHPGFARPGHFWGMSIDLNACTGCGACVIACQSENNISVVGKKEVNNSRDMQWIRIDRYYTSDMTKEKAQKEGVGAIDMYGQMEVPSEEPQVVFQPVMCMHCNHAPCETVCPVIATTHTNEGLNSMTYNRCVGTKYCANNCPYKVRR